MTSVEDVSGQVMEAMEHLRSALEILQNILSPPEPTTTESPEPPKTFPVNKFGLADGETFYKSVHQKLVPLPGVNVYMVRNADINNHANIMFVRKNALKHPEQKFKLVIAADITNVPQVPKLGHTTPNIEVYFRHYRGNMSIGDTLISQPFK